jgi:hypothetical protein
MDETEFDSRALRTVPTVKIPNDATDEEEPDDIVVNPGDDENESHNNITRHDDEDEG